MDNKYNGWTNYATWRINLELFDCMALEDFANDDAYALSKELQEFAEETIYAETNGAGLAYSYACAFLADVNWYEIAQNKIEEYADEVSA